MLTFMYTPEICLQPAIGQCVIGQVRPRQLRLGTQKGIDACHWPGSCALDVSSTPAWLLCIMMEQAMLDCGTEWLALIYRCTAAP